MLRGKVDEEEVDVALGWGGRACGTRLYLLEPGERSASSSSRSERNSESASSSRVGLCDGGDEFVVVDEEGVSGDAGRGGLLGGRDVWDTGSDGGAGELQSQPMIESINLRLIVKSLKPRARLLDDHEVEKLQINLGD